MLSRALYRPRSFYKHLIILVINRKCSQKVSWNPVHTCLISVVAVNAVYMLCHRPSISISKRKKRTVIVKLLNLRVRLSLKMKIILKYHSLDACCECQHIIARHTYSFSVEDGTQEYEMNCMLCGHGEDQVKVVPWFATKVVPWQHVFAILHQDDVDACCCTPTRSVRLYLDNKYVKHWIGL